MIMRCSELILNIDTKKEEKSHEFPRKNIWNLEWYSGRHLLPSILNTRNIWIRFRKKIHKAEFCQFIIEVSYVALNHPCLWMCFKLCRPLYVLKRQACGSWSPRSTGMQCEWPRLDRCSLLVASNKQPLIARQAPANTGFSGETQAVALHCIHHQSCCVMSYFSVETKCTIAHKTKKQVYYNLEPSLSDFYNQSYEEKKIKSSALLIT